MKTLVNYTLALTSPLWLPVVAFAASPFFIAVVIGEGLFGKGQFDTEYFWRWK